MARSGQSAAIEHHEFFGDLTGRGPSLGPCPLPVCATHLGQRRALSAAVRRDGLDLVDRQIEAVLAPILEHQVVPTRPSNGPSCHSSESSHPVLAMHHVLAFGQVVKEAVRRTGPGSRLSVWHATSSDIGLRQHGNFGLGENESRREWSDHDAWTRRGHGQISDRCGDALFGQDR